MEETTGYCQYILQGGTRHSNASNSGHKNSTEIENKHSTDGFPEAVTVKNESRLSLTEGCCGAICGFRVRGAGHLPPRALLPACRPHDRAVLETGYAELSISSAEATGSQNASSMADDNCSIQKRKAKKSTPQSPQTTKWNPSGRRRDAARPYQVAGPSPGHLRQKLRPRPRNEAAGNAKAGGEPEHSPPPSPREDARGAAQHLCPQATTLVREPIGGDARGEENRPQTVPAWRLHAGRSPPARPGMLPRVRRRSPTWSRAPAVSPLAAASSSAAIARATRPAPQPRGWRHGELRARPAPVWAAAPERGRWRPGELRRVSRRPPPRPLGAQPGRPGLQSQGPGTGLRRGS